MEKFLKGKTTTATTFEPFENVKAPVFIVCADPGFKPSFFEEHEITHWKHKNFFWLGGRVAT